jgi:hypothetical protein
MLLVVLALLSAALAISPGGRANAATKAYIIQFNGAIQPPAQVDGTVGAMTAQYGIDPFIVYYYALNGFAANLSPEQVEALETDPAVASVTPDGQLEIDAQLMPTGVRRVAADRSGPARIDGVDDGFLSSYNVAVVDTGVDVDHPDLNVVGGVRLSDGGYANCNNGTNDFDDTVGHGTGVAGVLGARDNGLGVVGVAPRVAIWSVKISNDGLADDSCILKAMDWVTEKQQRFNVGLPGGIDFAAANMSFSGLGHSDVMCEAVNRLVLTGVVWTASAGNSGVDLQGGVRPADCSGVVTVSAIADDDGVPLGSNSFYCYPHDEQDDALAVFSNFGPLVEIAAPGTCYLSTAPGGGLATFGGTSGAAPHVAGAFVLFKWMTDYAGSTYGPTLVQNMTSAGWTIGQTAPCGFTDYRDPYAEPLLWLSSSCGALTRNFADIDCSGAIDSSDTLKLNRHVAVLNYAQAEPCPDIGPVVKINGLPTKWGDVDCDGDVDIVDVQKVGQYVGGQTPSQQPGCPAFATSVTIFADSYADPDDDTDGVYDVDENPCGGNQVDPAKRPERVDGVFAGVDDDGDTQIDEPLPGGASAYDCDGDGYKGSAEANVFQGMASGRDQDPCGTNAWPADLVSGSIPDSTNRVNIADINSFFAPVRRLDTSPGNPNFNVRWDLVPGAGIFADVINIADLSSVLTVKPPMLGGQNANNGPDCPWP